MGYGNSWRKRMWGALIPFNNLFSFKIYSGFMRTRWAWSWWFLWVFSNCLLTNYSCLAIISSTELKVQLTTDKILAVSRHHQFKPTDVQHKCTWRHTLKFSRAFILKVWSPQYTLSTWKMTDTVMEVCLRFQKKQNHYF